MKKNNRSKQSNAMAKHNETGVQSEPERKLENGVLGGIIGGVCASVYDSWNIKLGAPVSPKLDDARCVFPGTTLLSVANMDALLGLKLGHVVSNTDFREVYRKYVAQWPNVKFIPNPMEGHVGFETYFGIGSDISASVGPIGWLPVSDISIVRDIARRTSCWGVPITIIEAESIAAAVYMARNSNNSKNDIKSYLETNFDYNLSCALGAFRPAKHIDMICDTAVQMGLVAFLESDNFEHALGLAIESGCRFNNTYSTDDKYPPINISHLACVTGTVAGAYYKDISEDLLQFVCYKIHALSDTIKIFIRQVGVHSNLSRFFDLAMEQQDTLEWLYGPRQK